MPGRARTDAIERVERKNVESIVKSCRVKGLLAKDRKEVSRRVLAMSSPLKSCLGSFCSDLFVGCHFLCQGFRQGVDGGARTGEFWCAYSRSVFPISLCAKDATKQRNILIRVPACV